ncbi:MAG: 8-oxo-dGTP diphosphatase MutT [Pseudomonadota bacterium]
MPNTAADLRATVDVAVAVLRDEEGRILLTQRHADAHQGGLWEFPGGKREDGETIAAALARELREELAIELQSHARLLIVEHDYGDKRVRLDVHLVHEFGGDPVPCEGQPMRWVPVQELLEYAFPKANMPIVERLRAISLRDSCR